MYPQSTINIELITQPQLPNDTLLTKTKIIGKVSVLLNFIVLFINLFIFPNM